MSCYSVQGKGWRYDFVLKQKRYSKGYFKTKREAQRAESQRKEAIGKGLPDPEKGTLKISPETEIKTGMGFLDLVNRRLDHVKAYNSWRHYRDHRYLARKWAAYWGDSNCDEITQTMVEEYIIQRSEVSPDTANKDLRYLRALFNFGLKKMWITENPTKGIDFLPVDKKLKYVPPKEDVLKVLLAADADKHDYIFVIKETLARMSEINLLLWEDVSFTNRTVTLYTRKKKGGHRTPRKIPMTSKLYDVLSRRYATRDSSKPWVFWHRYWSRKHSRWIEGPYTERRRIMKTLCCKAGVRYFRFHALRHFGASALDHANVNLGSIQRLLGHESRSTTEMYLHSIGEAEREAMNVLEAVTGMNEFSEKSPT